MRVLLQQAASLSCIRGIVVSSTKISSVLVGFPVAEGCKLVSLYLPEKHLKNIAVTAEKWGLDDHMRNVSRVILETGGALHLP